MDLFTTAEAHGAGELHFKNDPNTQLRAIIAIHSTKFGPAASGCRCQPYLSTDTAIIDALRLARGMSYKAALAGLPSGGGKAVLIRPKVIRDREAYFESFGDFIESLAGRYITAVDSGTSPADMDVIARRTRHVLSVSERKGGSGDPSPFTARGVRLGIETAVSHRLKRSDLEQLRVAIQGTGQVGYHLAKELHERGAQLTVTDVNPRAMERCADEFGARIIPSEEIYQVRCDLFSPCALGAVINDATIRRFDTRIIAGAANNQLEAPHHGQLLQQRGILFVPDYVINAGGLIFVMLSNPIEREQKLQSMMQMLDLLFRRSAEDGIPSFWQADIMAEEILGLKEAD